MTTMAMESQVLPSFDLKQVMHKVALETKWDETKLRLAECEYRQFLAVVKEQPGQSHVPSPVVDEVWHAHILFTQEYARDMDAYLGWFLHHNPIVRDDGCSCTVDCCTSGGGGACSSGPLARNAHRLS